MKNVLIIIALLSTSVFARPNIVGIDFGGKLHKYGEGLQNIENYIKISDTIYQTNNVKFFDGAQVKLNHKNEIAALMFRKEYSYTKKDIGAVGKKIKKDFIMFANHIEKKYGSFNTQQDCCFHLVSCG